MTTASQNSDILLSGILAPASRPGAAKSASQRIDISGESGAESFLKSFQSSLNLLQKDALAGAPLTDTTILSADDADTLGALLPLLEGQELAAGTVQAQLNKVIAQLKDQGIEVSEELRAVLAEYLSDSNVSILIPPVLSSASEVLTDNQVAAQTAPVAVSSEATNLDRERLLARLNEILGRRLSATGTGTQSTNAAGTATQQTQALVVETNTAVTTTIPMLERVANLALEAQSRNELTESMGKQSVAANTGQQTGTTTVTGNTAPAGDSRSMQSLIQTSLSDPRWQSDFSNKVFMMTRGAGQGHTQVAELRLNPQHMGSIEVRVVMKDDQASVSFVTQHSTVKDAIESSLPRLREMFNNSGLALADTDVSEQSFQRQNHNGSPEHEMASELPFSLNQALSGEAGVPVAASVSIYGLDLYA